MDLSFGALFSSFLFGSIGLAYFGYGKKSQDTTFIFTGIGLLCYSWFVDGAIAITVVGLLLSISPFVYKKYF